MNPLQILLTRHDLINDRRNKPMEELELNDFVHRDRPRSDFYRANAIVFLEDDGQTLVIKNGRPTGFQPQ